MAKQESVAMREVQAVARALDDGGRLRMLAALEGGELCVCQLTELLQLAPSTVSKHLSLLHGAGLIESRKQGRWVFYRPAGHEAPRYVRDAAQWALEAVRRTPEAKRDAKRLRRIVKTPLEAICRAKAEK